MQRDLGNIVLTCLESLHESGRVFSSGGRMIFMELRPMAKDGRGVPVPRGAGREAAGDSALSRDPTNKSTRQICQLRSVLPDEPPRTNA